MPIFFKKYRQRLQEMEDSEKKFDEREENLTMRESEMDKIQRSLQDTLDAAERNIKKNAGVFGQSLSFAEDEVMKGKKIISKKGKKSVNPPFFSVLHEFFQFIPEAEDVVDHVVNSILHKDPIILPNGNTKNPSKEEFKTLSKFMGDPRNDEVHFFLLKGAQVFGSGFAELGDTKGTVNSAGEKTGFMHPIITSRSQIMVDKNLFDRGVAKPVMLRVNGTNNQIIEIPWDRIFQYKRIGIVDTVYGEGKFQYNQPFFDLVVKAIKKNLVKMENKITTNLAFEYEKDVPMSDIKANARIISMLYAGWKKTGKQLHIPGGAKMREMKDTIEGLDYDKLLEKGVEMIKDKFNYPINTKDGSDDMRKFIEITINPEKRKYMKYFNFWVVLRKLGIKDWKVVLPEMKVGDSLSIAREGEIGVRNAGMTTNEWRERNDLPKIKEAWADKPMVRTDRYLYDPSTNTFTESNQNRVDPPENQENNPAP